MGKQPAGAPRDTQKRLTAADIKWWFGQTLSWAREGLHAIDAVEVALEGCDDIGFALPDDLAAYEKVYVDGLEEVGRLLKGVRARPQ